MAHNATWQLAQELLIHIVEFLSDSPADLRACALVSRSFVHAAQSQIFQEISFGFGYTSVLEEDRRSNRLLETLHGAPHLAQHVRRLRLLPNRISGETLFEICSFPFPRLRAVFCSNFNLSPVTAAALRQLLALPTLLSVEIACHVPQRLVFVELWSLCSPSIKHLDLKCDIRSAFGAFDLPDRSTYCASEAYIALDRRCGGVSRLGQSSPLPLRLFGSRRTVYLSLARSRPLAENCPHPAEHHCVCVYRRVAQCTCSTLYNNTLQQHPQNRASRRIFLDALDGTLSDELDRMLTRLPLHYARVVDFEMEPRYYDRTIASLPSTSDHDTRRTDEDPYW
ncbi:hypothetical protein B0H15DRAFT_867569, partial [Mycena belliarum]